MAPLVRHIDEQLVRCFVQENGLQEGEATCRDLSLLKHRWVLEEGPYDASSEESLCIRGRSLIAASALKNQHHLCIIDFAADEVAGIQRLPSLDSELAPVYLVALENALIIRCISSVGGKEEGDFLLLRDSLSL